MATYSISDVFTIDGTPPPDDEPATAYSYPAYQAGFGGAVPGVGTDPSTISPAVSYDGSATTNSGYGQLGAFILPAASNQDYYVAFQDSSGNWYWKAYTAALFTDGSGGSGSDGELDVGLLSVGGSTGAPYQTRLVGATTNAGSTTGGPPTTGDFFQGDLAVDSLAGAIWICVDGDGTSPGTWVAPVSPGDIKPTASIIGTPPVGWLFCDGSPQTISDYQALFDAITVSFSLDLVAENDEYTVSLPLAAQLAPGGAPITDTTGTYEYLQEGTTVATVNTGTGAITLSPAPIKTGSSIPLVVAPWGVNYSEGKFNVPNLRGSFPFGAQIVSDTPGLGAIGGSEISTALLAHSHNHDHGGLTGGGSTGSGTTGGGSGTTGAESGHHHDVTGSGNYLTSDTGGSFKSGTSTTTEYTQSSTTGSSSGHTHGFSFGGLSIPALSVPELSISADDTSAGSGSSFSIMPPYAAVNYLIKT